MAGATAPLSSRESAELAAVLIGTDDHPWPSDAFDVGIREPKPPAAAGMSAERGSMST